MASPLTKTALRSLETGKQVAAAGRTHKERIAAKLEERYRKVLHEGETMPDWALVMELNSRLLDGAGDEVIVADEAYRDKLVQVTAGRDDRNGKTTVVQGRIRGERKSFAGAHGEESLMHVGLDRPPEQKPLAVHRQGEHIVGTLRRPGLPLSAPRSSAVSVDPAGVAEEMEPEVAALGQSLDGLDRLYRESDQALVNRKSALASQRRTYVNVARSQEAYYRLAEEDELADRIRPSLRRATRKTQPVEGEPSKEGEQPGETGPPAPVPPPPAGTA
jgi:hypothetical protein